MCIRDSTHTVWSSWSFDTYSLQNLKNFYMFITNWGISNSCEEVQNWVFEKCRWQQITKLQKLFFLLHEQYKHFIVICTVQQHVEKISLSSSLHLTCHWNHVGLYADLQELFQVCMWLSNTSLLLFTSISNIWEMSRVWTTRSMALSCLLAG